MQKIQKHIEIIRSTKKGLSSLSLASALAIQESLSRNYQRVGITTVNNLSDLEAFVLKKPDLAFIGMEYVPSVIPTDIILGKKIWISTFLEKNGINHTGSGRNAAELERYKALAKQRVLEFGLSTSPYIVVRQGVIPAEHMLRLSYPLFVKPACLGAGQGIDNNSIVYTYSDLQAKVRTLNADYAANVLVEEFLPGREFSVAVLMNECTDELMAMPIEIVPIANKQGERILTSKAKSSNLEKVQAVTDVALKLKLVNLAKGVFVALGARDYGRIDIRLDKFGVPHFLEANLIPSLMKDYGNFPKACFLNLGMDYETMLLSIVSLGLTRSSLLDEQVFEPWTFPALRSV
jgi:D-alanine-D-alanine ligase